MQSIKNVFNNIKILSYIIEWKHIAQYDHIYVNLDI